MTNANTARCPRCLGTGNFCNFGVCFRCRGRGTVLTARGRAAAAKAEREAKEARIRDEHAGRVFSPGNEPW